MKTHPEPLPTNHVDGQESSVQRFLGGAVRSHPIGARSVLETNVGRIQTNRLALLHAAAVVCLADLSNELNVENIGHARAVLAIQIRGPGNRPGRAWGNDAISDPLRLEERRRGRGLYLHDAHGYAGIVGNLGAVRTGGEYQIRQHE